MTLSDLYAVYQFACLKLKELADSRNNVTTEDEAKRHLDEMAKWIEVRNKAHDRLETEILNSNK